MLLQGDVRNLVPVKCLLRNDLEMNTMKSGQINYEDDVGTQVLASNPFQPGSNVSSDGELILELWRGGRLEEYYARPRQVSDTRAPAGDRSATRHWAGQLYDKVYTGEKLFWEFRRRNVEKCHRNIHSLTFMLWFLCKSTLRDPNCSPAIYSTGKLTHFTFTRSV